MQVRPIDPGCLGEVVRIEYLAYPEGLSEPLETFVNKRELFPRGALGAFEAEALLGYVFCLPWLRGQVVPLSKPVSALPEAPDTLYIHDLAVDPAARGLGVARVLFQEVRGLARALALPSLSLVAVQGSDPFWHRMGFRAEQRFEYGPGHPATRMALEL